MKYRIYVDVLFANNFFIHLCLLFLLNKLLKCTATHLSVILGSLIGTIGSCLVLFLPGISPYIKVFIVYSGVCLLMVRFGLRIKSFYTLIKATIYFYLLSFVFGGILDWIFLMIPSLEEYRVGVLGLLSVILIITVIMYTIIQKIIHKKKSNFYSVQIKNKGTVIKLTALLDTGNHLVEPISNRPVSIIEKSVIQDMLVKKELRGYCIIPFHSVGKEHGIMEGYELEAIEIKVEDGIVRKEKAVVAVCEGNISNSKQYQMILNPKLLED